VVVAKNGESILHMDAINFPHDFVRQWFLLGKALDDLLQLGQIGLSDERGSDE
jgi:hypothetical protein